MNQMPVWVHLSNIPLELFTSKSLSYIASALGNPLYMDSITANQQRLAFAKVCFEMNANLVVPRFVEFCPKKKLFSKKEWVPKRFMEENSSGKIQEPLNEQIDKELEVVMAVNELQGSASSMVKRKSSKGKGKAVISGSENRFEILNDECELEQIDQGQLGEDLVNPLEKETMPDSPRRPRGSS
ncbi:hypothetical protein Gotur_033955 [Gossypium turneri]